MSGRRRVFSRSIREMLDVNNSVLLEHPSPDPVEMSKPPVSEIFPYLETEFLKRNYNNEDLFERRDSCPPQINKREASYGSLLSILSENSSQTISSCSFDEETDNSSTYVMAKLDRVDDLLYDGKCCENMNEKLKEDCLTWSRMLPHFRTKGTNMVLHSCPIEYDPANTEMLNEFEETETILEHHDPVDKFMLNEESFQEDVDMALVQRIQEKVLTKLVDHLLAVTLEWRAATEEDNSKFLRIRTATASRDRAQLRPMTAVESHRSILPPVVPTPFRPLEGILVVSSKVLQNRRSFNYLSRPGSSSTRVKMADHGEQLLKNRLSKLNKHLENIQEGNSLPKEVASLSIRPDLRLTLGQTSNTKSRLNIVQDQEESKDAKECERPFSLPPVHGKMNEQVKDMKKSHQIQLLMSNRNRSQGHPMSSRPPSGRDILKSNFGEPDPLTTHETLPAVCEENNFLKIRPIMRSSHQMKHKSNPLYPLSAHHRRTNF